MTSQVVSGAGFLFRNDSLEDMMLKVSHLFRPLVHSRPLRTVIKVEQYVLTASRLHRGKHTERRDQRGGGETVLNSYDKKCFQSLKDTMERKATGTRRKSGRTRETHHIERHRRKEKEGGDRMIGRGGNSRNCWRKGGWRG